MADVDAPVVATQNAPNGHAEEHATPADEEKRIDYHGAPSAVELAEEGTVSHAEDSVSSKELPDPPTLSVETPTLNLPNGQETPRTADFFDHRMHADARSRTDSQSTAATTATRPSTRSSLVFVVTALETISASKDARKNKKLGDSTAQALAAIKSEGDPSHINPEILFEPLQLASEAHTVSVSITALDCIGKLISYSYFSVPADPHAQSSDAPPLIERAIDTICDCFQGEATHPDVQLQIVKSLLAAILNDKIVVHGAGLLKAVRLTYNIFLLSKSSANQQVAQGALTQMVGTVFERVKGRLSAKEARVNVSQVSLDNGKSGSDESIREEIEGSTVGVDGSEVAAEEDEDEEETPEASEAGTHEPSDKPVEKHTGPKITLQSFENNMSFNDDRIHDNAPTLVTRIKGRATPRSISGQDASPNPQHDGEGSDEEEEDEIFIRDAYLVFRAMCRLSTKSLQVEHAVDIKSQGMRSKLLSLHIIHTILHNNIVVFISPYATIRSSSSDEPTTFVQAIKQYLCLSLSRNGASSVNRVFEVSCEIFWLMLKYLRVMLKKEIEVFLKEIYLAILERRTAAVFQKQYILIVLGRLAADPRALVEIYLNYDCDRTALDNMYQRIVEHLSRISSTPVAITPIQQQAYQDHHGKQSNLSDWQARGTLPPALSTASMHSPHEVDQGYPLEYAMKQESLEALVEILRSLVNWSQQGVAEATAALRESESRASVDDFRESIDNRTTVDSPHPGFDSGTATPLAEDDPNQLEKVKQRKTALTNAVRLFNFKPKRGMKALLKDGFIKSEKPEDVARFLLDNDAIDKASLGEFLGEGDAANIAIMHAFVDYMDFAKTRFVDALRRFLQSFRLPGEAQKIDRFMLKFAERYITGNPNAFANADTAYVLAYSVILLNTDQHSTKMKGRRMTPEDFIKNNRGINDNADLPEEYLLGIYDEIAHNEIVLYTERAAAANQGIVVQPTVGIAANIGQALATVGRDLQREAYVQASEEMANKTEQLYKSLLRAQRRTATKMPVSKFIPASSFKHVGPMFEVTWMPFLTALSGQAQEGHNIETMKAKNVEALKVLLEVAHNEGNHLKESWRDILTCVSQLDRFQLISTGVDERAIPDVLKAHMQPPTSRKSLTVPNRRRAAPHNSNVHYQADIAEESRSTDMIRAVDRIFTNTANLSGEAIVDFVKALTQVSWQEIESSGQSESPRTYSLQKLVEISGYNMTRVRFEWTNIWQILGAHFNDVGCHTNTNVVFFALNSLRQLSMRFMEIEELPGFKFQKDFLKPFEHIISNTTVVQVKDMVLRCLIQMIQARGENIRSGWRTMFGVFTVAAREPYVEGIVSLAFENITQVYNTRFGVVISQGAFADLIVCLTEFSKNYKFQKKSLQAIELLKASVPKMLRTPECPLSVRAGFVKDSEQGSSIPKQPTRQTQEEQFWFPVLFAFHDVLMTGEDLEVRSRSLNYLFETLIAYGHNFPQDFWDMLWRQLLYPIFMVLKSKSEMNKVLNHEELSVWLSTTMIQALRNMIKLFTHFFESLEYMLDRFLDLLALCICQENDTLARIGSNCLQQLILQNVQKFQPEHWHKIVNAFVELFNRTEATALFSAATASSYTPTSSTPSNGYRNASQPKTPTAEANITDLPLSQTPTEESQDNALGINGLPTPRRSSAVSSEASITTPSDTRMPSPLPKRQTAELEDYRPDDHNLQQAPVVVTAARRRFFNQIITKCVLQLLMIETVQELFTNDAVYEKIPSGELLRLMAVLKKSYQFAKRFNADRDLRTRLFREGFMKQPPNLLKQESGSASVYVSILFRMYHDTSTERAASRAETEAALVPLCEDIVASYIELDEETQQRNIVTWRPVVVTVLDGYTGFPEPEFEKHVEVFAPLVVGLLGTEMVGDVQRVVQALVMRIFEAKLGIPRVPLMTPVVRSPRGSFSGGVGVMGQQQRRGSRGR
ncbi:protein transport protein sec72 [Mytilinidion resinicola]|uniref:Protein transport protein sec72 n=1 Tax=Mytilinidion resinicola TaxID=574789 RepID=A0A6A6ZAG0_9PEZI|nr:protein transport protein sec72 [Mytilinidion resinicola]KAF2817187.1 protein transport protein sec72 [Mytilinidion resinicola]